ncbi:Protein of unknown function [Bacillus mycoides]|nr:Protein of unknown function [Bacillus mycoides]
MVLNWTNGSDVTSNKQINDSWRVDETYIKVKGQWMYLYRAVDSNGKTIDFCLSKTRNHKAAKYEEVKKWEQYTNKMCTFHSFEGQHFFLHENIEEIVSIITRKFDS